jgi:hypothetical protein
MAEPAVDPPTPVGLDIQIGDSTYTVLRLGTPVFSKSANASFLKALDFHAAHLTLVAAAPVNPDTPQLSYVAWCTQSPVQKLVTSDLYKALAAHADETSPGWRKPGEDLVTLPDGRTFSVPATAADWAPVTAKKRKLATVKMACDVLAKGVFVLDDELLAGGKVHPGVKRVAFDPDAVRLKQLTSFAEMLLCMSAPPSIEALHSWAKSALEGGRSPLE